MGGTLQIDPRRWRMLFADGVNIVAQFMSTRETLSEDDLSELLGHLDEVKLMARAWHQAGRPPKVVEAVPPRVPEKKKGGWPKGRSRKNPMQAIQ